MAGGRRRRAKDDQAHLLEGGEAMRRATPPPPRRLDDTDIAILRALNRNARKSFRDMARELGVSLTTVSNHVKRLEKDGVIQGYFPLIDTDKVGFDLTAIIGVRVEPGSVMEVQSRIGKNPRVFAVYDVTGDWDSVVIARFMSRAELNEFIKKLGEIPHVERTTTQIVLNRVKDERRVLL